jgi:hypothetical protein
MNILFEPRRLVDTTLLLDSLGLCPPAALLGLRVAI